MRSTKKKYEKKTKVFQRVYKKECLHNKYFPFGLNSQELEARGVLRSCIGE